MFGRLVIVRVHVVVYLRSPFVAALDECDPLERLSCLFDRGLRAGRHVQMGIVIEK